jgi:hypothetical protein
MIKPDFWADEKIGSLQPNTKLLYIGMWNFCDDIGVTRSNAAFLRANIFPYDDKVNMKTMRSCCDELLSLGLILEHSINKESFYYVKNFNKHQKIDRPSTFRFIPDTSKHNVLELFNSSSTATTLATDSSSNVNVNVNVNVKDSFDFDLIYAQYPRKVGKSNGMKKLHKIINTQELYDKVMRGVINYKEYCKNENMDIKYIKVFSTFVSGEHWNDEYYSGKTGYTDDDIEKMLNDMVKKGVSEDEKNSSAEA